MYRARRPAACRVNVRNARIPKFRRRGTAPRKITMKRRRKERERERERKKKERSDTLGERRVARESRRTIRVANGSSGYDIFLRERTTRGGCMGDGSRPFFFLFDGSRAPRRDSHFARVSRVVARVVGVRNGRACTRARIRDVPRLRRAFHRPVTTAHVTPAIYFGAGNDGGERQRDVSREDEARNTSTRQRDETSVTRARIGTTRTVQPPGPPRRFRGGGGV